MRFLVTAEWDTNAGNAAVKSGKMGDIVQSILEDQRPEAVYFALTNGRHSAIMIIHMDDASDMPRIAAPWFLAFNAKIDAKPVMTPEDLAKAGPDIQHAVEKYG